MKRIVLVLIPWFFCACVLTPFYGGRPPAPEGNITPPDFPWKDFRGAIHCHSFRSHDCDGSDQAIIDAAHAVGLDFVLMTDHLSDRMMDRPLTGWKGETLFLYGVEKSWEGASLLLLGLETLVSFEGTLEEITERVHREGGLVFLGHLEAYRGMWNPSGFDGIEIYNLHAAAKLANPVAVILRGLFFFPKYFFRALAQPHPPNFQRLDEWSQSAPIPVIAGNDSHANVRLFGPLGGTVGTYEQTFRTVTTHIWARELSRREILDALREGRSYIAFEADREATGFSVSMQRQQGRAMWKIFVPQAAEIVVIENGEVITRENETRLLEFPVRSPEQVIRVEVYLNGRPWIFSGPCRT